MAKNIEKYTTKFYGVLPARVEWLKNVYGLPDNMCELLVMGADDQEVKRSLSPEVRSEIRLQYDIEDEEFLIVTGGKIDAAKSQILKLMEAVRRIKEYKVKLLIFGSVDPKMNERFELLVDKSQIQYIGWVNGNYSYDVFSAADLVIFPGRHSVYWEQVCGQGKPMFVKYWEGTTHIDLGGNVEFLYDDTTDEMYRKIIDLLESPQKYLEMKSVAERKGMSVFSYKTIAKKSICY